MILWHACSWRASIISELVQDSLTSLKATVAAAVIPDNIRSRRFNCQDGYCTKHCSDAIFLLK